jgi:uncharacterized protein (TIGR02271 family)
MTTMQKDEILKQRGEDLYDSNGDKIGSIEEIYLDAESGEPEWALVKTGMFGTKSTFVPLRDVSRDDDMLRVPYDKDRVKDAPKPDPDGELSKDEEAQLYRHYGLEYSELGSTSGLPRSGMQTGGTAGAGAGSGGTAGERSAAGTGGTSGRADVGDAAGTATSGAGGGAGDAMTRSEEELRVGTTQQEAGRVRLRKYVESEDVQETVPVGREEPRVEREPITDDNVDAAMSGPEISEGEHEVVLHEEEVVAEKRAVPKERVRLDKDTVTDERDVSDTVRKERIEVDESDR